MDRDFDGVFRFTNPTEEDFKFMWNSKEYTFKAMTTSPMVISGESPENVQEIRKRAAYQLAVREFYKGEAFKLMESKGGTRPALYDEKLLQPIIDKCLAPLPTSFAEVSPVKPVIDEKIFKNSAAMKNGEDPNTIFKDRPVQEFGMMPTNL